MRREDVNEIGLAALVVAAALLAADCVWLHVKCARQTEALAALEARVERHVNPPPKPGLSERMRDSYEKAKAAAARGYEKLKSSAARQCESVREKLDKED